MVQVSKWLLFQHNRRERELLVCSTVINCNVYLLLTDYPMANERQSLVLLLRNKRHVRLDKGLVLLDNLGSISNSPAHFPSMSTRILLLIRSSHVLPVMYQDPCGDWNDDPSHEDSPEDLLGKRNSVPRRSNCMAVIVGVVGSLGRQLDLLSDSLSDDSRQGSSSVHFWFNWDDRSTDVQTSPDKSVMSEGQSV